MPLILLAGIGFVFILYAGNFERVCDFNIVGDKGYDLFLSDEAIYVGIGVDSDAFNFAFLVMG